MISGKFRRMKKNYIVVILLAVIIIIVLGFRFSKKDTTTDTVILPVGNFQEKLDLITITNPRPNQMVTSPLTITGQARGNWYFEASFPVRLLDANGKELAVSPVQAQGDWMTTEFVPYSVTLNFTTPTTKTGILILQKDNPSGLPENDDSLIVPVIFSN